MGQNRYKLPDWNRREDSPQSHGCSTTTSHKSD